MDLNNYDELLKVGVAGCEVDITLDWVYHGDDGDDPRRNKTYHLYFDGDQCEFAEVAERGDLATAAQLFEASFWDAYFPGSDGMTEIVEIHSLALTPVDEEPDE